MDEDELKDVDDELKVLLLSLWLEVDCATEEEEEEEEEYELNS